MGAGGRFTGGHEGAQHSWEGLLHRDEVTAIGFPFVFSIRTQFMNGYLWKCFSTTPNLYFHTQVSLLNRLAVGKAGGEVDVGVCLWQQAT